MRTPDVMRNIKAFCTMQLSTGFNKGGTGPIFKFIIESGSETGGRNVAVYETLGRDYPIIYVTGRKETRLNLNIVIGKGDKYWMQESDSFKALVNRNSSEEPIIFQGIPGYPSLFYGVVGESSREINRIYGLSRFSIVVHVMGFAKEPQLGYKKFFLDRVSDTLNKWTDIVNNAYSQAEKIYAFQESVQGFFKSAEKLISSGTQFIDMGADVINTLKNPLGAAGALGSLDRAIFAYKSSILGLIASVTDIRTFANNPYGYFTLSFPRSKNTGIQNFSQTQALVQRGLSNISALSFIDGAVRLTTELSAQKSISLNDVIVMRSQIYELLKTLMDWNAYYGDNTEFDNDLSALMRFLNGIFYDIYNNTLNLTRAKVSEECLPLSFYYAQKETRDGFEQFMQDNMLQNVLFIPAGTEVYLR